MKILNWIVLFLTICGTLLNANGSKYGFYFWIVTNFFWTYHNGKKRDWPMAALFLFYIFTSTYGLIHWTLHPVV